MFKGPNPIPAHSLRTLKFTPESEPPSHSLTLTNLPPPTATRHRTVASTSPSRPHPAGIASLLLPPSLVSASPSLVSLFLPRILPSHNQVMSCTPRNMEANMTTPHDGGDEEEYVLLDLDGVSNIINIPPNAKYILTGLDTLNPVLIIDDKLKLIGEYEETIGTCIAFTEQGELLHEENDKKLRRFTSLLSFRSSSPSSLLCVFASLSWYWSALLQPWSLLPRALLCFAICSVLSGLASTSDNPVVHEESGPSDANLFSATRIIDSNQPPTKEVKPLCQLHKVLKFKISPDSEIQSATTKDAK
ncbi:hypothetical protein Ahy_A08g040239 isoform B [Arachis hypogaea]|uniref:Transcription factor TFIIIC triple barrel domain-containing protein n=2 Tax=Arachis hypogaea TaxID=3818 RepID=A0A445BYK6_ARAHY|nr:hypothetical protein Ahy_A08g040239 isoform B [Arachis hypogaea]